MSFNGNWGCSHDIHAPSAIAIDMDGDTSGAWAPILVSFLLLSIAGWGLGSLSTHSDIIEVNSNDEIPRFFEHFTDLDQTPIPLDHEIRLGWYAWDENDTGGLGIPAASYRASDLSINGTGTIIHETETAKADLGVQLEWKHNGDELSLNATIDIHMRETVSENLILRMIIIEDELEIEGRTPNQNAVVRLYRMSIAVNHTADGNTTHIETFPLTDLVEHGLPKEIQEYHRIRFVVLLSDYDTEENFALLMTDLPMSESGPENTGAKAAVLIGLGCLLLCLGSISRAEWKREYMLPRLTGKTDGNGMPIAIIRTGGSAITLREVRVNPPWRLARAMKSIEIPSDTEKTFQLRVKPERGHDEPDTNIIHTEWSIEVEKMGGWVLDLVLRKHRK